MEGYTFSVCDSMKNIQIISGAGGCITYVCKHLSNIDKDIYVFIKVDVGGNLEKNIYFYSKHKYDVFKNGQI